MNPGRSLLAAAGLSALLCPAPSLAQPAAPAAAGLDCMIQPHQVVQVGTASAGVIQHIRVDRGDYVRRGQPIVQLKADVERATLAMAREKAAQVGELQATRGAQELALREAQRAAQLVEENFVSRTFFDKQRAEATVASGRGAQAQERIRLAQREVELASAQLAQRTVVSPIDGVVVERFVSPGEYVEQKPVLRIAEIDPLRVDVLVPAASFGRIAVGAKASVVPELLARSAHAATVTSVDRVVDAASNTFRVRLEMPNPGGKLPPGLRCKAELGLDGVDTRRPDPGLAAPQAAPAPAVTQSKSAPTVFATQTQVRRVDVAIAQAQPPAPPTPALASLARREEAARPPAPVPVALRTPAPVPAAPRAADPAAAAAAPPPPLRLKLAAIEWPTTVASVTPQR
jgi:membrane fusion protein, heavy metal efflux system